MICGTSAFHDMAADNPPAPSKASKKHHHGSSSKNPYSSRGLEKFSSVRSELESRKKKIMESTSSHGVAMVRFMYSDSRDWIPVIVRLREDNNSSSSSSKNNTSNVSNKPMLVNELPPPPPPLLLTKLEEATEPAPEKKKKNKEKVWWRRRPSYYMPVAMVLILLCFVISGRAFAICCISAFWYSIPALKGDVKDTNFINNAYMNSYKNLLRRKKIT